MRKVSIILTCVAFLFVNAAPFTVVTEGLKTNPSSGTTLADTGTLGTDVYESTPINVVLSSSSRVQIVFEHIASDGQTVLHSHTFNVDGSFYCQLNQGAVAGEKYRLRILTTLLLGATAQGSLSSAGF